MFTLTSFNDVLPMKKDHNNLSEEQKKEWNNIFNHIYNDGQSILLFN